MPPLSPNDLIETRRLREKQTMRFPADPDTTIRLRRLMVSKERVTWWRRLFRLLANVFN